MIPLDMDDMKKGVPLETKESKDNEAFSKGARIGHQIATLEAKRREFEQEREEGRQEMAMVLQQLMQAQQQLAGQTAQMGAQQGAQMGVQAGMAMAPPPMMPADPNMAGMPPMM